MPRCTCRKFQTPAGPPVFETLDYAVHEGVAVLRLNRPLQHNAVNSLMSRELPAAWAHFNNDATAIVAIVTGTGDKAFCAGADLRDLPSLDGPASAATLESIRWTSLANQVWKPVICAVNGLTVGGGLHFVADSDLVIAAATATFSDSHVNVGLVAGLEPVSLCRRMPLQAVLRMALVGGRERLSAQRAYELGLVGEVVAAEALLPRAFEIAAMIKLNSPLAMARTKQAIWEATELGLSAGLQNAWRLVMEQLQHADAAEGPKAFTEKRAPRWLPPEGR